MAQSFQQDCVDLAFQRYRRGEVSRRTLLAGLAALGATPAISDRAVAQTGRQLVMVNWGGIANEGFGRFYGQPFMDANAGVRVVHDSSASSSVLLGRQNLLNRIDYNILDRSQVIDPGFALEWGAAPYSFSSVLCYDSARFPNGGPQNWADFFDLRRFPGTRLLRRDALATLDAVQMALGKDPRNLYPLDVRACLARVREIRRNAVFWNSGSESEQFLRTGEAVMGQIWHTRANVLQRETNGRIKFIWTNALLQAGIFVIPRGNAGGELAQRLLASMLARPEPQVGLLQFLGNGPTNPAAAAQVPQEFRAVNPTDPENARQQVVLNGVWWGDNYQQVNADFIDAVTG